MVRRHDAQTGLVAGLLTHHPAVERMADERRQAWVEAWQVAVGDPLLGARPTVAPSTTTIQAATAVADSFAVIVVSPYGGLSELEANALHDRLLALPREVEVIVVLGTDVLDGPTALTDEGGSAADVGTVDDDSHRHERIIDLTRRSASAVAGPSMPSPDDGPQPDSGPQRVAPSHSAAAHPG